MFTTPPSLVTGGEGGADTPPPPPNQKAIMLYVLVLDNGVVTFADIEGVIRWVAEMMKTLISPPNRAFVSVGNGITITTIHGNNSLTIKASVVVDPMGSVPEESVTREYRVFRAEIPKGCRGLPS